MLKMPVGIDSFAKVIGNKYYYVDKSNFIKKVIDLGSEVTLCTRPRRFGKTLCMSMLAEFFDIRKDSKKLFEGLKISENTELCNKYMNQYPTAFITLKDIRGNTFEDAYAMLANTISKLYKEHIYLFDSNCIDNFEKGVFDRLRNKKASLDEVKDSLLFLTSLMKNHYNKPVVLLIDEYDVPVAKAEQFGYYKDMIDVISSMLSQSLKGNPSLNFAVVTGCLRIAKESIFTGLNNISSDNIMDFRYDEFFGFTEKEVKQILLDAKLESHFEDIKEWYDGYKFGNTDVYCPWDVVNYVRDLMINENAKPKAYWNNTSDNAIVKEFIRRKKGDIVDKMETLIAGGTITETISSELTYDVLYSSEQNIWSVLYLTGYLTKVSEDEEDSTRMTLRIPNKEISFIFRNTVLEWFKASAETWDRKNLFSSIWDKQADIATTEITKLLRKTISYHDYKEDFYHAFLAGIFAGVGYSVESNREHGDGRSDIVIRDIENGRVAVFEIKYSKEKIDLQADCERAIEQIDTKRYAEEFLDDFDEVICYGISFFKKQCKVLLKK